MPLPTSLPCKVLDKKHEEWVFHYPFWEALRKLAEGGQVMYQSAGQFLFPRSMEPSDVYRDRLSRFVYTNHFGNIKGWYTSALFKQSPSVILRNTTAAGDSAIVGDGPIMQQLAAFQDDCDRAGRSLVQFWSEFVQPTLLTYRRAFVLFDLPASNTQLPSKQAQREAGALRPHLVAYSPQDVINWQTDEQGNLLWIVLKLRSRTQDSLSDPVVISDRWYFFDRKQVSVYTYQLNEDQATRSPGLLSDALGLTGTLASSPYDDNQVATLEPGYPRAHALADQNMVPVFRQSLHPDQWIGQRISSPLLRLLNLENAHDWALEQSNLATLVVFTDRELDKVQRGEAYYLQLAPGDKLEYAEQSGKAFEASQRRIGELREEIYRLAYLVAQGRSSSASASMQSGYSKEQDMLPARDVLSTMGEQCRGAFQQILQAAADRMELNVDVSVQGFDFLDRADVTELEVIQKAESIMEINSPTREREIAKRVVRIQLPDANRETIQTIDKEIDTAPTPSEQQQQQQDQSNAMMLSNAAKLANPKMFADAADAE